MYTTNSYQFFFLIISPFLWRPFHVKHLWWSNVRWEFVLYPQIVGGGDIFGFIMGKLEKQLWLEPGWEGPGQDRTGGVALRLNSPLQKTIIGSNFSSHLYGLCQYNTKYDTMHHLTNIHICKDLHICIYYTDQTDMAVSQYLAKSDASIRYSTVYSVHWISRIL